MSIAYVNGATATSGSSNATTISLTCPNSAGPGGLTPAIGDIMVVITLMGVNGTTNPPATKAGWSLDVTDAGTTSVQSIGVYTRKIQSGDVGTAFSFTSTTALSRQYSGMMLVYRGQDATTHLDASIVTNKVGSVTSDPVVSDNTGTMAGTMSIAIANPYYTSQASDGTYTTPSGWTQRTSVSNGVTTARKQMVAYERANGSSGTETGFTLDVNPNPNTWMTQHILLRPAASGSRVTKTATLSFDVASPISELSYPVVVAHRGGPGPEETLGTYQRSFSATPSSIGEGDMQLCSTGETVLMHDSSINRTASGTGTPTTGNVNALTISQWRTSRVADLDGTGISPEAPGELAQLATEYGAGGAHKRVLCLEVKDTGNGASHMTHLTAMGMQGNVIVNTAVRGDAQAARDAGFEVMYQTNVPNYTNLAADGVKHLSVGSGSIDSSFVTTAHSNGIKVWAYTVNTVTLRDSLLAMGVDGFFSDTPALLAATRVTKSQTLSYDVRNRGTKSPTLSFDVKQRATKAATASFDALQRLATSATLSFNSLVRTAAKTGTASYDVKNRGTKNGTLSYNLAARDSASQTLSFDVRHRDTKAPTLSYDVAQRGTKTGTASYDVRVRGSKNGTLSFDVRERGTKSGTVTYDVQVSGITRVTTTRTLSYDTKGRTTKAGTLSFNVRLRDVTADQTLSFDVLQRGTTAKTLSFNVTARNSKSATASYDVRVRGGRDGTLTFDVKGRPTKSGTLSYDVLADIIVTALNLWYSDGEILHEIGSVHQA